MGIYTYCPACGEDREIEIREEKESYPVKNEQTEIIAEVTCCKHCGEQIWNEELDEDNLKKAYTKYRSTHGLLQPEDIKRIREKYSLTQTTFARILGFGEKTIARYENGSIQDQAQNNLIELTDYPDVFELLLKKSEELIPGNDLFRAKFALEKLKRCAFNGPKTFSYDTKQTKYKYDIGNEYFGGLHNVNVS